MHKLEITHFIKGELSMEELKHKDSWLKRNWGWVLGGGCLLLIVIITLGIGSLIFGVSKMFTSSEPYKYAFEQALNNDKVIALLGEPIETDGIMEGNISLNNDDGEADFEVPIRGPKGEARIIVIATKDYDNWTYEKLYVQIKDTQEEINLLKELLDDN